MRKLREIIPLEEIFDSSYPVKISHTDYPDSKMTDGFFKTHGGTSIHVDVMHNVTHNPDNKTAHVVFHGYASDNKEDKRDSNFETTGYEKNHASKVFGTVKKVLQAHLKRHPDVKTVNFSGDQTHSKLYDKLMNKHIGVNGKRREIAGGAVDYEFDANKLRESEIQETFDSSYPVEIKHDKDQFNNLRTTGKFKTESGTNITSKIFHFPGEEKANVNFSTDDHGDNNIYNTTGIEKNKAGKVFGTVKKLIQAHLKKHPEVKEIQFAGDKNHSKLYDNMSKNYIKNGKGSKSNIGDFYTVYSLNADKLRESFDTLELQDK